MSREGRDVQLMQCLVDGVQRQNSLTEILIHSMHVTARMTNSDCPVCQRALKEKAA